MATYAKLSTIHTPATNVGAPASWGLQVDDNFEAFYRSPRAAAGRGSSQSVPNATWTPITWTSQLYEQPSDTVWLAASPTKLFFPVNGLYVCSANVTWDAIGGGGAVGSRTLLIRRNGSTEFARVDVPGAASTGNVGQCTATDVEGSAGDYIEAMVIHFQGAAAGVCAAGTNRFTCRWVGAW